MASKVYNAGDIRPIFGQTDIFSDGELLTNVILINFGKNWALVDDNGDPKLVYGFMTMRPRDGE